MAKVVRKADLAADNVLKIRLLGRRSSFLTVTVTGAQPPDVDPPVLTLVAPPDGLVTSDPDVTVSGTVEDASPVTVTVNGVTIEYLIDGSNRRVGKTIDGVLVQGFLYADRLSPVVQLDGNNGVVARFVFGTRPGVPDYMIKDGTTYRIVSDHLGSVRLVVDVGTGEAAQRIDYDEFGRVVLNTNPGFQPFCFAGGLYDDDTELTRFGSRDYDAFAGRWTTKDPAGLGTFEPNRYSYVGNNPINLTDPFGLDPCWISTAAGQLVVDQSIARRTRDFINEAVRLGWGGDINEDFRSSRRQQELFDDPPGGTPIVANPGTSSHEAGFALDLQFNSLPCEEQRQALLTAAAKFGFSNTGVKGEPWHFFAGTYGPYGDKAAAIEHNQRVFNERGGLLPTCIMELPWRWY